MNLTNNISGWLKCVVIKSSTALHTSSPIISDGRRPGSSGGISDPRLEFGPEPGVKLPLRNTSILGVLSAGVLISGTLAWK